MDAYEQIQTQLAAKYGKETTTRKAIGDFMLSDNHAVNVKSNNVDKENYSLNMISIKKMHEWVFEERKELSFLFVDYSERGGKLTILKETAPIPIEHISWDCLTIEAQGYRCNSNEQPAKDRRESDQTRFLQRISSSVRKIQTERA